ncbi:N-acetyltransferase family protein [Celerinatantimonas sp. YJH-8]|uniref:GNAT family N-acetyltransferase n=1 Tax=Celerinatantimonas sp. YJH-8 TaxID=3228714 RepID=UPI0038BFA128
MISIRKATQADSQLVQGIYHRAILGHCLGTYSPKIIRQWTQPVRPIMFEHLVEQYVYIAVEDQEPVGISCYNSQSEYLNGIYIEPRYMGSGIGKMLLQHQENLLISQGKIEIELRVTLNAVPFYRHLGYSFISESISKIPLQDEIIYSHMIKSLHRKSTQNQRLVLLQMSAA